MNKPSRLRTALLATLPDLATNPEKLRIYVDRGHIVSTGAPVRGWEYRYEITAIIQDFAGDMDALTVALVDWLAIEQPDMLKNPEQRNRGVRFEAEFLSNELADVQVQMDVTEAVGVSNDGTFMHAEEPPADLTSGWQ